MGNMLRFEFRRLLKKPSFYVCLALCAAFTIIVAVASKISFDDQYRFYMSSKDITGYYEYDSIDSLKNTFASNFSPQMMILSDIALGVLPTVLAIFSGIFVCEDKVRGTIKNIYARGYSRTSVFFSKFIVSSCVALALYIVMSLILYLSGLAIFSVKPFDVQILRVNGFVLLVLGKMLSILALNAMYFMLSELIGSTGFSIAANIFLPSAVSTFVYVALNIWFNMIRQTDWEYSYGIISKISEYWIYSLVNGGFSQDMKPENYVWHLIACMGYLLLFGLLGWLIARKKQVKN